MSVSFGPDDFQSRPQTTEPKEYPPLPDGRYRATVTGGAIVFHQDGDEQWELQFTIQEGPHAGRLVWNKYRINHPNAEKQQWEKNSLGQVFDALGFRHHLQHPQQFRSNTMLLITTRTFESKTKPGKFYNAVRYANPLAGRQAQPADGSAAHFAAVQNAVNNLEGSTQGATTTPSSSSAQKVMW